MPNMASDHCDVVVLGMGTCGEDAALRLARAGMEVVGIEAKLVGGECPYWACLPTKSLVRSANLVAEARRADGLVGTVSIETDWAIIARRLREEITGGWDDAGGIARFQDLGGRFLRGYGEMAGPKEVVVGDHGLIARRGVLVATGSTPSIPPIPGLAETSFWTTHDAIATEVLPGSLAIIGGGAVGCELGQIFARFGVAVTIVEGSERLLAHGEPEASSLIAEALAEDSIRIVTGHDVAGVSGDAAGFVLTLSDGVEVSAEKLLVAVGREGSAASLSLQKAGAVVERGFVSTDEYLRAGDGLWAIGDVTGPPLLTQKAEYQGRIAVEDILGGAPRPARYETMPVVTFTDPEIASIGLTEEQAIAEGRTIVASVKRIEATFRGWVHRVGNRGMIKLVIDSVADRIVGATVVGPNAGEIIGFLHLAVDQQVSLAELVDLVYPFPTLYGGIGEALGAYGRGIVRVLDPDTFPLFGDPELADF